MYERIMVSPGSACRTLGSIRRKRGYSDPRDIVVNFSDKPRLLLLCVAHSNAPADEAMDHLVAFAKENLNARVVFLDQVLPCMESESEKLWGEVQDLYSGVAPVKRPSEEMKVDDAIVQLDQVDLAIAIGGDGTILKLNKVFQGGIPPVIGLSMGSLGYMAKFNLDQVKETLLGAVDQGLNVSLRSLLFIEIFNDTGQIVTRRTALNECVIDRGLSPFITTLDVYYGGNYFTTVSGDGLLVATPTGSTAYSMAAGGPIVHPSVDSMLFTFICPHSISYRPLVLPVSAVLEVNVPQDNRGYVRVCIDGNYSCNIKHGFSVRICAAKNTFPLVLPNDCAQATEFCRALKEHLHWNVRVRQQKLVLPTTSMDPQDQDIGPVDKD